MNSRKSILGQIATEGYPSTPLPSPVSPGSGGGNIIRVWRLADLTDRQAGRVAYQGYHTRLTAMASQFGHRPEVAWGVFAAMSPQSTESMGYTNTARMLAGRKPKTGFTRDRQTAQEILSGADPAVTLRGPKTRAFYRCIADPGNQYHVVVDGHMHALWLGRLADLRSVRSLKPDLYARIADDFRLVAQILDIPAPVLQATCWYTWRRLRGLPLSGVDYHTQAGLWE